MNLNFFLDFFKEWKWAILLLSICIIGIPFTIAYGLQSMSWGNDFWPNVFSEFLGMFVELIFGAIFTFLVIDKYTQYNKNRQWRKIKGITYKNLYFSLSNLLLKLNVSFQKEMRVNNYILAEDIETLVDYLPKADFNNFVKSLTENITNKIQNESCDIDKPIELASFVDEQLYASLIKFKQHSRQDISNLSNLTIPKLLTFSDDIILLDDLIELEELLTALLSKIKTVHHKENNNEIKCIWLIKLREIITKIGEMSDFIKNDINLD